jgi:hypothetical protein
VLLIGLLCVSLFAQLYSTSAHTKLNDSEGSDTE